MDEGLSTQSAWYFARNGTRQGPVSRDALKAYFDSGRVAPSDLVWCAGFTDWKTAAQVFAPAGAPPPLPKTGPAPEPKGKTVAPVHEVTALEKDNAVELQIQSKRVMRFGAAQFGAVLFAVFGVFAVIGGAIGAAHFVFYIGMLLLGLSYSCIVIARKKYTTRVLIDADGIEVRGKRYAFAHISGIGYDSPQGSYTLPTGGRGSIAMASNALASAGIIAMAGAVEQAGCRIYMLYGDKPVTIVSGLTPQNVAAVHARFMEYARRYASFKD